MAKQHNVVNFFTDRVKHHPLTVYDCRRKLVTDDVKNELSLYRYYFIYIQVISLSNCPNWIII